MADRETWAVGRLLGATTAFLADKGSTTPRLDAELLLARVLGLTKVQLYVNFEREVAPAELDRYRDLVRRRSRHEPVAYILGEREFYGLKLKTTPAALIPRPETEHLVDEALRLVKDRWPEEAVRLA
ncbi:MAG: protein-(glutamine-N5) methyltransferase, release factor-specific, partial [Candidatus Adiutrix sp.]|nr:protein-(glutamine-N5) methyltransferase, release factor-specific [Candidatus Adiutrix sp.]